MLWTPAFSGFSYITGNVLTTRPTANFGTSFTAGASNTFSSYTQILASGSIAYDCYGILININGGGASGGGRSQIATIGIDYAGGSSYTDFILDLACTAADSFTNIGSGYWYYFPMKIPAGSSLAIKGKTANGSSITSYCAVWLYGKPDKPEFLKAGTYIEAIGADESVSGGTSLTAGTTSEGAWTLLGTTSTDLWGWQFSLPTGNGINGQQCHFDFAVGDGSNFRILAYDCSLNLGLSNYLGSRLNPLIYSKVQAGENIYARAQYSLSTTSGWMAIALGIGG